MSRRAIHTRPPRGYRFCLEHVPHNRSALSQRVPALAAGGVMARYVPCRDSGFAWIHRLLGNRIGRGVLFAIYPSARQKSGYPAYYGRCVPPPLRRLLEENGLDVDRVVPCFHSDYFSFGTPLYACELVRQLRLMWLGIGNLAESLTVIARKPFLQKDITQRRAA